MSFVLKGIIHFGTAGRTRAGFGAGFGVVSLVALTGCIARVVGVVRRWLLPHHVVGIEVVVIIELDFRDGKVTSEIVTMTSEGTGR